MPDDRGERIENSTSATLGVHLTYGLAMASDHPYIWSGVDSPVFTIYKGERKVLEFEAVVIKDFLQGFRWFLTLFNWYGKLKRVSKEDRSLPKLPIGWIQETKCS
ncbi:hypothetical protein CK203_063831 [Vitis vinifera]|uniref:Uncharacterized protein n=1 Tax=Vitis vinifera TaxID=29760 RepID=A0A438FPN4_VITVI|nr:hypothetical protein CK203_063831 [Vitis vinifera]